MNNDYLKVKELYHYGIKGQKWGVRRFQNEDGTLTPEGRSRYYNSDGTMSPQQEKNFRRDWKKNINNLSNQAHKNDPKRRRGSTGKNWDESYEKTLKELTNWQAGKSSIFDKATNEQEMNSIFEDIYMKSALKDLGLSGKEYESALKAIRNPNYKGRNVEELYEGW